MKSKESKTTKKTKLRYIRDEEESDDGRLELGLLDVEPDNFNPTSNLCEYPFFNILCDDKMLKNNQFEGDDEADDEHIHQEEHEHEHLEDENGLEVGVESRVHDPTIKWNQMKPTFGELYDSPAQLSCNCLAKHYIKEIIRKPKMTFLEMMEDVLTKYSVKVLKGQCHIARVRVREMIEGKLEEPYAKIWDYANEILRSNPESTCKVGVSVNPDGVNYFQRFYGQIKGEILTAIGRDANNHVYPTAWAVVNVENKENWTWFLQLLVDDLGVEDGRGLIVISDQHKDGEGTSKQKAVKLIVKRKKKTKKAGEGSSNQATFETANDATVQEENATVQETVQEENATGEETVHATAQEENGTKYGYEPHEIAHAMERVDANEIQDHLLEDN
ncbi:unnamed protein product [Lactuca saligna]|uniref:MULE transposase domain-containing protein n=1 Tax=Lactuca saligna TaxID=75948 RepID=A0AA35YGA6_LACSI|nr:unnamed protein product [Lactuca saligna]